MSELSALVDERFSHKSEEVQPFQSRQKKAYKAFQEIGFPTRKTESWKYTSCAKLLKTDFVTSPTVAEPARDVADITLLDGKVYIPKTMPSSIVVCDVLEAMKDHGDLIASRLGDDAFSLLNLALIDGGVFVHVPKNTSLDQAVTVQIEHSDTASVHHMRNIYLIDDGANAVITENFKSDVNAAYFHNVVSEIHLKPQAKCTYIKVIDEGVNAFHIAKTDIHLSRDATAHCHSFAYGSALVRSDSHAYLNDTGAHCDLFGLSIAGSNQHIDHHTSLNHLSPHATSGEVYKSIVGGQAKVVFNGNIFVEKDAQKTNAALSNKNILLSPNASVDTKPQLEIFADDVKCAHGTTVGQLDPKAIFYLTSRGIEKHEAKQMLIQAFAKDVIEKVENEALKQSLLALFENKLRKVA